MEEKEDKLLKNRKRLNREDVVTKGNLKDCLEEIFLLSTKKLNGTGTRIKNTTRRLNEQAL